jgi:hypothetical protein
VVVVPDTTAVSELQSKLTDLSTKLADQSKQLTDTSKQLADQSAALSHEKTHHVDPKPVLEDGQEPPQTTQDKAKNQELMKKVQNDLKKAPITDRPALMNAAKVIEDSGSAHEEFVENQKQLKTQPLIPPKDPEA